MENQKFIVQTPKAVIDKGKLALIFGLVFTVPVLIFTAIFDAWNTSAKVLTHRTPRLEVYGLRLRVVGPGKKDYSFSIEEVARAVHAPSGKLVLFDQKGEVLLSLPPDMENLNLLDQYLFGKD